MKEQSLAPTKVEYVVVKPNRKGRAMRLRVLWCLAILLLIAGLFWYFGRDRTRRFKALEIPTLGLKAGLKAKWVDGKAHYVFVARPLPGKEGAFHDVLQSGSEMPFHFEVRLLDTDGFQLCFSVPDLIRTHGPDGIVNGLKADQTFEKCTENEFALAKRWDATYDIPRTTQGRLPLPSQNDLAQPQTQEAQKKTDSADRGVVMSKLTGSDFLSGAIETLDGGSFRITREAEYMTLMGWEPGSDLKIDCRKTICVITNVPADKSVHAKKK